MNRRLLGLVGFAVISLVSGSSFSQTDSKAYDNAEARPRGSIRGIVRDHQTKEPLAGVSIDVVGRDVGTVTGPDGRYQLALPPGRYDLRIWSPSYQPMRAQNVFLGGDARRVDVALEPEAPNVAEEYVIEAAPDASSIDSLALERKRSAAVGDSVGRAEMGKSPDRNAAQAARRVVGVSVVGGRFVYVRGLGERYTNALLNGAPLPSPEPDRAAVPLDIFPALVLDKLTIVKTFTPDVPGDFAGGSVRVETRSIPEKPLFQLSVSGGYDTQASFRERLSHRGGSLDWLGIDDGTRALPESIPRSSNASTGVEAALLQERGRELNTYMSSTRAFTPPNHSLSVVAGDSWKLGGEQRLGAIVALNYGRSFNVRDALLREFERAETPAGEPTRFEIDKELRRQSGHENVSWGAYGSVSYELSPDHRLTLLGLHSQLANKDTYEFEGRYSSLDDRPVHNTRLQFVTRTLDFVQLSGDHGFPELGDARLDYNLSFARARRYEPDTRDVAYVFNRNAADPENPWWTYVSAAESGRHFFSEQHEDSIGAGADWTQPLGGEGESETRIKLGGLVNVKSRNFEARRFRFGARSPNSDPALRCPGFDYSLDCPDTLFVPSNVNPDRLLLEEGTGNTDAYDAKLGVYAAYLMADVALASDLRLIVGPRLEITEQTIEPYNPVQFDEPPGSELHSADVLPALAVVYSPTDKAKTRASITRTLARPQLRELAPFAFNDYFGGRQTSGNPDLTLTHITNADLRFEYFPSLSEALAFSIFYKHFDDPIEQVITSGSESGSINTFQNAEGATLIGVELEARKNLGFLSDALDETSVISNLTLSRSRIQVTQTDRDVITNLSRPMVNQAPYVFNLALDWTSEELGASARVAYNLIGPRVVAVGTDGRDDAYEQPRHTLDFSAAKKLGEHFELKLSGSNVLNRDVVVTQGREYSEDQVLLRYSDGAVYTLSASYTY